MEVGPCWALMKSLQRRGWKMENGVFLRQLQGRVAFGKQFWLVSPCAEALHTVGAE